MTEGKKDKGKKTAWYLLSARWDFFIDVINLKSLQDGLLLVPVQGLKRELHRWYVCPTESFPRICKDWHGQQEGGGEALSAEPFQCKAGSAKPLQLG